ncbi:FAD-linked oxidase C-terminal domain-containing protein [Corticibacterium sp. UT-5YL-CI-8]|nr:FAD-linked oxidase C-terminal domain-containing protein [Tianweitania sp. UT-5YL-CI-8]
MIEAAVSPYGEAIDVLRGAFGDRLSTSAALRDQHCGTETYHAAHPPDAVLFAESVADVQTALRVASDFRMPVIPHGAGSSLEGHLAALRGGLSLDLSRLDRILAVNEQDLDATVEAGVTRETLNTYLRDTGLFFPVDPGANATIGGMAATRASGTNAVRYGTMRENVLSVTAVMADGRLIRTARRARKSAAGYDLTRLLVGSEGTLAVFTDVTVRLYGVPEVISAGVCSFQSLQEAVEAVIATVQAGIAVARIELLDPFSIRAFNAHSGLSLTVAPTLFVELHGTQAGVADQANWLSATFSDHGGHDIAFATSADERNRLWRARHQMHFALLAQRPGARAWGTDVCVPISRLAECIAAVADDIAAAPFPVSLLGHVGDGNFHLGFLLDTSNLAEMSAAARLNDKVVDAALSLDGTCTGEHGVGYGKAKFMAAEHGEAIEAMRIVKKGFDPLNILNPGKLFADRAVQDENRPPDHG